MDYSRSDDLAEREKSDAYLTVLKKRIAIFAVAVFAVIAYLNISDSARASDLKAQMKPLAARLETAVKTGDQQTIIALIEPSIKILNDYNELSEAAKQEIDQRPLRYCHIAATHLVAGIAESIQQGVWLSKQKYFAALEMCK